MSAALLYLADEILMSFMLVLALVPVGFLWQDSRRRQEEQRRLRSLKREARLAAQLRSRQDEEAEQRPLKAIWPAVPPRA